MPVIISSPVALPCKNTPGNQRRVEDIKKKMSFKENREKAQAEVLKKKLENVSCTIKVAAGEDDKLFGSVTSQNIADALARAGSHRR